MAQFGTVGCLGKYEMEVYKLTRRFMAVHNYGNFEHVCLVCGNS